MATIEFITTSSLLEQFIKYRKLFKLMMCYVQNAILYQKYYFLYLISSDCEHFYTKQIFIFKMGFSENGSTSYGEKQLYHNDVSNPSL